MILDIEYKDILLTDSFDTGIQAVRAICTLAVTK